MNTTVKDAKTTKVTSGAADTQGTARALHESASGAVPDGSAGEAG